MGGNDRRHRATLEQLQPQRRLALDGIGGKGRRNRTPPGRIEFIERAVRLVAESGRPITHVAADLGVGPESKVGAAGRGGSRKPAGSRRC
jgi:hypothetical protein